MRGTIEEILAEHQTVLRGYELPRGFTWLKYSPSTPIDLDELLPEEKIFGEGVTYSAWHSSREPVPSTESKEEAVEAWSAARSKWDAHLASLPPAKRVLAVLYLGDSSFLTCAVLVGAPKFQAEVAAGSQDCPMYPWLARTYPWLASMLKNWLDDAGPGHLEDYITGCADGRDETPLEVVLADFENFSTGVLACEGSEDGIGAYTSGVNGACVHVLALLEAGASQEHVGIKQLLGDMTDTMMMCKMTREIVGAEVEVNAVLACAKRTANTVKEPSTGGGKRRKTAM